MRSSHRLDRLDRLDTAFDGDRLVADADRPLPRVSDQAPRGLPVILAALTAGGRMLALVVATIAPHDRVRPTSSLSSALS